jgi:Holliday junction DNA helicase RuvB
MNLVFYEPHELQRIIERGAGILGFDLAPDGAAEIAGRSRGTPRVAGRLLRRVRDFASVAGRSRVDAIAADAALTRLEVDRRGLDAMDRRYLKAIAEHYAGGPVGVDTMAAMLSEQRDVIEDVIEPYLIQQGFVMRTPRGRVLTHQAFRHLGLAVPRPSASQLDLLTESEEGS